MKILDSGHSTKNWDCPAKFRTVGQSVETPVNQHNPAVSALLTIPLSDHSNYCHYCHTPSLRLLARPFTKQLRWRLILHCCSALLQNLVGNSGETQYFEQQAEASMGVPYSPLQIVNSVPFVSFVSISILSLFPFSILSLLPIHHPFFLF